MNKKFEFSKRVKTLRAQNKLSLQALADLTDSSKSYIWDLENNNIPYPSAKKLSKIADVLGITIQYLLDGGTLESAKDTHFYRKYQSLDNKTKQRIRSILALLGES